MPPLLAFALSHEYVNTVKIEPGTLTIRQGLVNIQSGGSSSFPPSSLAWRARPAIFISKSSSRWPASGVGMLHIYIYAIAGSHMSEILCSGRYINLMVTRRHLQRWGRFLKRLWTGSTAFWQTYGISKTRVARGDKFLGIPWYQLYLHRCCPNAFS